MTVKRSTLAVVCLATAVLMLDIAVVNTALPHIARDLHAGLGGIQWVVDAYTLALATVVLSAGSLADRLGRRRVFSAGLVVFTLASLACAFAGDIAFLDGARAVQGLGAAVMFACSLALLADAFGEARERAGALAAYGATIGAAFAVGPLVGGALTSWVGWRAIFLINVPLALVCLAGTRARVRESRDPKPRRLDRPGQVTLTGALFLLVLALLRGNQEGWTSAAILAELAGAVTLFAAFLAAERRSREPMLPLGLFRIPAFTGAQVAAFAISGSFFAVFLYTTLYLQNVLGMSPLSAGLVYIPGTVVMFLVSGATAQLGERVSPAAMIAGGLALVAGGMALLTLSATHSSWTVFLPGEMLAMIGTGLFNPAVSAVALGSAPQEQSGLAAGVNDTFRQAGIAVGVAAFGALVPASAALGHGSASSYVTGMHHALLAGAALAGIGAVASALLIGRRRPTAAPAAPLSLPTEPVAAAA